MQNHATVLYRRKLVIYSFMLLYALHIEIEMKNLNLQVTLLVQKGVGTSFPSVLTPLHPWVLRKMHQLQIILSSGVGAERTGWTTKDVLCQIWANSQKHSAKKLRHFLTIFMKLYFLVVECINKGLLCHKKHVKYTRVYTYKINKLFLVTSCFSLWGLLSNWPTWKF